MLEIMREEFGIKVKVTITLEPMADEPRSFCGESSQVLKIGGDPTGSLLEGYVRNVAERAEAQAVAGMLRTEPGASEWAREEALRRWASRAQLQDHGSYGKRVGVNDPAGNFTCYGQGETWVAAFDDAAAHPERAAGA